ncbi:MAG: FkbM family methyltransferase [Calditrichae bacterium]|nr:FkbM family methyltransferase [Calditrichia bacterium]
MNNVQKENQNFYADLMNTFFKDLDKFQENNYDEFRFKKVNKISKAIRRILHKALNEKILKKQKNSYNNLKTYLSKFADFYNSLQDDHSKELLINLITYRILGYQKVKLPQNTEQYWENLDTILQQIDHSSSIQLEFMNWKLNKINLSPMGFPIKLYQRASGINTLFFMQQYEYHSNDVDIMAEEGDYVIDAGGCWGDTAVYFAYKTGESGNVYTFEFIPSNLEILNKNLELNPDLKQNVEIVENPVWSEEDITLYYKDNGPGSKVSFEKKKEFSGKAKTISIDHFVTENNVGKIDFIKMDIEGAETKALEGAVDTITKFKPKLAISIYHSLNDFSNLYKMIENLDLGYEFYLDHSTIHSEETVLFARVS